MPADRFTHPFPETLIGCTKSVEKVCPNRPSENTPFDSLDERTRVEVKTMFWKVTLMRSGIGLSKRRNDTLVALGLRKRFRTVYKPVNPQIAGLLLRVKELVKLELVNEAETKEDMKAKRKPDKGYVVESVGGSGYVKPMDV